MANVTSYTKTAVDAKLAAKLDSTVKATATVEGVVELATNAETTAGTDTTRAVTPAGLKAVTDALPGGSATTDASLLTSGTLPTARIANGSITDGKLASGTALSPTERTKLAALAPIMWQPSTAYTAGQVAISPTGDNVTAKIDFTTGSTFDIANWNYVKVTTVKTNDGFLTANKLNVTGGTNNDVLTKDATLPGGFKWAPPPSGAIRNTVPGLVPNDVTAATANSAALAAFVADTTRGPLMQIAVPGSYYFNGAMDMTNPANWVRELYLGAGVELVQTRVTTSSTNLAYGPWFKGSILTDNVRWFAADAARGSWTITLEDASGIIGEGQDEVDGTAAEDMIGEGTVLYLFSDDLIHSGGKYRNAALVRVVTVSGNTITLDKPLYRSWTTAKYAGAVIVEQHPSILWHGPGKVRHNDPWACGTFFAGLGRFEWCKDVTVGPEVTLGPGPGSGIELFSVWGFNVQHNVSHLLSDDAQGNDADTWHPLNLIHQEHYGYGTSVGGGTRDGFVGGTAHHIRHAFTTTAAAAVVGTSTLKTLVETRGGTGTSPGNGGDPCNIKVAPRVWNSWQQCVDTHEAGNNITIDVSGLGGGTWDDTVEEATQGAVSIRAADVTVTGRSSGAKDHSIIMLHQSLSHSEYGVTTIRDWHSGPSAAALWLTAGPNGSRIRIEGTTTYGAERWLYLRGTNPFTITGEGNYVSGTDVPAPSTIKSVVYSDANVPSTSRVDLGLDIVDYSTLFRFNSSGMSQSNVRLRSTTDRRQLVIVYDGTAWPTTRPPVPAGDLTLVSPTAGVTAPSWMLRGDTYRVATV